MADAHIYEVGTVLTLLPKCSHRDNHRVHVDYSHDGNGIDNNSQGIKFQSSWKCTYALT